MSAEHTPSHEHQPSQEDLDALRALIGKVGVNTVAQLARSMAKGLEVYAADLDSASPGEYLPCLERLEKESGILPSGQQGIDGRVQDKNNGGNELAEMSVIETYESSVDDKVRLKGRYMTISVTLPRSEILSDSFDKTSSRHRGNTVNIPVRLYIPESEIGEGFDRLSNAMRKRARELRPRDVRALKELYDALISASHLEKQKVMNKLKNPSNGEDPDKLKDQLRALRKIQAESLKRKNGIAYNASQSSALSTARWSARPVVMG